QFFCYFLSRFFLFLSYPKPSAVRRKFFSANYFNFGKVRKNESQVA
ncbi:CLUMA_CG009302, isoform A, partial [Clunio marinus]